MSSGERGAKAPRTITTLDELRRFMVGAIDKIGGSFTTPEDDWVPAMAVQTPEAIELMTFDYSLFASGMAKDMLGEMLRLKLAEDGAYRYALLINAHESLGITPEQAEQVRAGLLRIEQLEGSRELLALSVGDAETEQFWRAYIGRRPDGVRKRLHWERLDTKKGYSFTGRFAGLNEYLREPRR